MPAARPSCCSVDQAPLVRKELVCQSHIPPIGDGDCCILGERERRVALRLFFPRV